MVESSFVPVNELDDRGRSPNLEHRHGDSSLRWHRASGGIASGVETPAGASCRAPKPALLDLEGGGGGALRGTCSGGSLRKPGGASRCTPAGSSGVNARGPRPTRGEV